MSEPRVKPPEERRRQGARAIFEDLLADVELARVWLHECQVKNSHGMETPRSQATLNVEFKHGWSKWERGFDAVAIYLFRLSSGSEPAAEIEVAFGLRYITGVQVTDRVFELFATSNLMLNSWPYAREFLSSTIGRFGWAPITLPVFRTGRGITAPDWEQTLAPAPRERPRRPRRRNAGTDATPDSDRADP